jgi:cephalosporin hydroxylase
MYDTTVVTDPTSRVRVTGPAGDVEHSLYSREGLEMVGSLWLKLSAEYRLMYQHTWFGVPIIQLPSDVMLMQELVWRLRPDVIVECGIAHGGSTIFYASLLELIGKGKVIAVDVEVRQHNRVSVENHPLAGRIEIIEGSSTAEATVKQVESRVSGSREVLVILDSNHSREHVREELDAYHRFIPPGGYLVVMDGAQAHVWDTPKGKPEWRGSHPLQAIEEFLEAHPGFEVDPRFHRAIVTSSPRGFLRRKR